jgi:hypothetical protein
MAWPGTLVDPGLLSGDEITRVEGVDVDRVSWNRQPQPTIHRGEKKDREKRYSEGRGGKKIVVTLHSIQAISKLSTDLFRPFYIFSI